MPNQPLMKKQGQCIRSMPTAPLAEFEFPAKVISSYLRSWADQWHENGGRLSWRSIKQVGTSTTHHHAPPCEI